VAVVAVVVLERIERSAAQEAAAQEAMFRRPEQLTPSPEAPTLVVAAAAVQTL
jgi:hypothetical protein